MAWRIKMNTNDELRQKFVDEISGDWGGKCYRDLVAGGGATLYNARGTGVHAS